jgi:ferrochelatase
VAFARAATPNADRRFARLAIDLIDELRDNRDPSRFVSMQDVQVPPLQGFSINGALCTPECVKT